MSKISLVLFLLLLVASFAFAEVEVMLPGLEGHYSVGGENSGTPPSGRQTPFEFPVELESLDGLQIIAEGPWTQGQYETCFTLPDGSVVCDTLPSGIAMTLRLTSELVEGCEFLATFGADNSIHGDELLIGFCEEGETDFDQLLGAEVTAELYCDVPDEELPRFVGASFGTVMNAKLVVLGATPVTNSTWGTIKSFFR